MMGALSSPAQVREAGCQKRIAEGRERWMYERGIGGIASGTPASAGSTRHYG